MGKIISTKKSTLEAHKGEKTVSTENEPGETGTDGGPPKDVGTETKETNLGRTRRLPAGDPGMVSIESVKIHLFERTTTELMGAGKSLDAAGVTKSTNDRDPESDVLAIAADGIKRKTHTKNPGEPHNN